MAQRVRNQRLGKRRQHDVGRLTDGAGARAPEELFEGAITRDDVQRRVEDDEGLGERTEDACRPAHPHEYNRVGTRFAH